ncbi:MAG: hypothetical protein ACYDAJ_06875 [Nitrosotalea sp.]
MKKIAIITILFVAIISVYVPANASAQSSTSSETGIIRHVYADPLPQWASFDSGVVDRALKSWEDTNPNLTLQQVSSPDNADLHIVWAKDPSNSAQIETQYGLKGRPSNGVTILPQISGLSNTVIIVTLGNEGSCFNTWFPNSPNTLARILEHETGHFLGFDHTPNPYGIMHEGAPQQYFEVTRSFEIPPNSDQLVRMWCAVGETANSPTSFNYKISTDDTAGFNFSFFQVNVVNEEPANSPSPVPYTQSGCSGQGYGSTTGTCLVSSNSILGVKLLDDSSGSNKQLMVKFWPQPSTYLTELEEASAVVSTIETSSHLFNLPANTAGTDMARNEVQNMQDFPAQYTNTGVKGMVVKNSLMWQNSVIVYVKQSEKSGTINLDLKRSDIDSKVGINDGSLALLSDGSKISWIEKDTDTDRYLTINFNGLVDQILITKPDSQTMPSQVQTSYSIPTWIKNNAKWWSEGSISDNDFIKGIQYLIQQEIIHIPQTTGSTSSSQHIPQWVKNAVGLWANGQMSDDEFVKAMQYLISNGIMIVQ